VESSSSSGKNDNSEEDEDEVEGEGKLNNDELEMAQYLVNGYLDG